jgi:hypothetical protein
MALYDLAKDLGLLTRWNEEKQENEFYTQNDGMMCIDPGPGPDAFYVNKPKSPNPYGHTFVAEWIQKPLSCSSGCGANPDGTQQCVWGWYHVDPDYSWAANGEFSGMYNGQVRQSSDPPQLQDLEDWIASHSGWPTSATRALEEATKAGEPVEHETPTVSGPAKVDGPVETKQEPVSKTNPDGSTTPGTKTTTSTTNYTNNYNDNRVTITTTVTNTHTTVYQDGTTETDTDEQTSEPGEEADFSDKALPDLPKLYEPKYPDGPKGVWNAEIGKIKASPLFQLPSKLGPNLGDSGGCPQWTIPLNLGIANFGTQDVSLPCSVWAFLRVCCIVGALFLARALIFGG